MSCRIGDVYVGLTDDPERRKGEHGDPKDWRVVRHFTVEDEARAWERQEIRKTGQCGGTGGEGWRFGYKYTVTASTTE